MEGKKEGGREREREQQPDDDSGSDRELSTLSSAAANDMKPVIYRRQEVMGDQMTNYTL